MLEDHFLPQLSRFKGLGDYSEDFVEQAHQIGIREESRTSAIRDRDRVAQLHCKFEHRRSLPAVQDKQLMVQSNASRKRKAGTIELQTAKKNGKLEREEKRTRAITTMAQQEEPMKNGRTRNRDELKSNMI